MVFRSLHEDVPSYMKDMFTRVKNSTVRSVRNPDVNPRLLLFKSAGSRNALRTVTPNFRTILTPKSVFLQP